MKRPLLPIAFASIFFSFILGSQTSISPALKFEAASIRTLKPGDGSVGFACRGVNGTIPDTAARPAAAGIPQGRCNGGFSLKYLVAYAYDVDVRNVVGGPAWAYSPMEFFAVEAKAENTDTATKEDLRQMLRTLFADRFQLKIHRETREVPGFALVLAKGGTKLQAAPADTQEVKTAKADPAARTRTWQGTASVASLAYMIAGVLNAPVVDKTGMAGMYVFTLNTPLSVQKPDSTPSIFTTVQEDLGLHLDAIATVPIEVIVIDSAEKPTDGGRKAWNLF